MYGGKTAVSYRCDSWHVVGLATSVVLWVDGSPLPLSVNAFWHAMQAARLDGCLSRPRLGKRVAASDCSGAVSLLSAVGLHSGCAPAHDVAQQAEGHWCASVLSSRDLVRSARARARERVREHAVYLDPVVER